MARRADQFGAGTSDLSANSRVSSDARRHNRLNHFNENGASHEQETRKSLIIKVHIDVHPIPKDANTGRCKRPMTRWVRKPLILKVHIDGRCDECGLPLRPAASHRQTP